ncbi:MULTISPECIES: STAS domain-containing protein [unclassified Streptomyces]|uniref:STAS domain-containing protein n=1 Tax=unclassified Streptomyces TaxID=2593676 RepID=UPI0036C7E63B
MERTYGVRDAYRAGRAAWEWSVSPSWNVPAGAYLVGPAAACVDGLAAARGSARAPAPSLIRRPRARQRSGLGFWDCAGLSVLLELRHRALSQGKTVTIRVASPEVERLLEGAQELFSPPLSQSAKRWRAAPAIVPSPKPGTPPGDKAQRTELVSLGAPGPA